MEMIRLFGMDVDGTLTDGKIYMGSTGEIFKAFDVKDGYAINNILTNNNIVPIIITARESQIVSLRARELGIEEVYQDCKNKRDKYIEIAGKYGIHLNNDGHLPKTAFIGDDISDIEVMKVSEISGCPYNAAKNVKTVANYVSPFNGGDGAVRDFIEWIIDRC